MMPAYFAERLEGGFMNYNVVFAIEKYKKFQAATDAILAVDGFIVNPDGTVVKATLPQV